MKMLISILTLSSITYSSRMPYLQYGEDVTINAPVHEDLYVAGGTVTVNAPVYGDLVVTGGRIDINDSVTHDILLAGGTAVFNGYAGDDIRCAGARLQISKDVGGDLVITGGKITIDKDVIIHGNLLISGGEATLNGTVKGNVNGGAGQFTLNGKIEKEMDCRAGEITVNGTVLGETVLAAKIIEIGSTANFHNDVRYWNKEGSLDFKGTIKNGNAAYDPELKMETGHWLYLGFASFLILLWYLGAALLMIFILQYLFGVTLQKAAGTALSNSLKSIGFGFLFFIAVPIAVILSFFTIIGVPVGLILLFVYITVLFFSITITSLVAANWINNVYYGSRWKTWKLVLTAFGIFIVLKLASLTPFVGALIMAILVCLAFGAILLNIKWRKIKVTTNET
jgi:cytoskeletal protein CcmA (bactofilin family)